MRIPTARKTGCVTTTNTRTDTVPNGSSSIGAEPDGDVSSGSSRGLLSNWLAKPDVVAIEVLDAKFSDSVGFIAKAIVDLGAAGSKLCEQGIHIVRPEVDVPHTWIYFPVGDEGRPMRRLIQHQTHSIAF